MDRARSLRILGLPKSASDDEILVAYWSLRAHVESRLAAAGSGPRRDALANELAQLDAMGEGLAPAPPERHVRLNAMHRHGSACARHAGLSTISTAVLVVVSDSVWRYFDFSYCLEVLGTCGRLPCLLM